MAASRKLKTAGWAAVGVAGAFAGLAALDRRVGQRFERASTPEELEALDLPADVIEHEFTMSDGWSIRVLERGPRDGRPFVLLHGITLSAGIWPFQLRDLADAGYRVVAVDLRGHAGSAPAAGRLARSEPLTLERLGDDVYEVLALLDLTGAVLVGHSMGGMVALTMMARDEATRRGQGRISALGLVATAAGMAGSGVVPGLDRVIAWAEPILKRGGGVAARLPGRTLPRHDLAYLLARLTFGQDATPTQVRYAGQLTAGVPARVSGELILAILAYDQTSVLASIGLPAAVVVGDHDLLTPPSQAEVLAAGIPDATLDVLPGCGHMVMLERPTDLAGVLVRLADRADRAGRGEAR